MFIQDPGWDWAVAGACDRGRFVRDNATALWCFCQSSDVNYVLFINLNATDEEAV